MVHQYAYEDSYQKNNAWLSTILTVLVVVLFFLAGWATNDLYERYYMQKVSGPQYGIGGGPGISAPILPLTPTPSIISPMPEEEATEEPEKPSPTPISPTP